MNANQIESKFAEMGARLVVREVPSRVNTWSSAAPDYAVDIQRDRKVEFFELRDPGHLPAGSEHFLHQVRLSPELCRSDEVLLGRADESRT